MTAKAHFEIFPAKDGFRWRLVAANGEPVAQSEGYETQPGAERGAEDAANTANATIIGERNGGGTIVAMKRVAS
jgi:uncharacterized protein YegP (UPF0339 family)